MRDASLHQASVPDAVTAGALRAPDNRAMMRVAERRKVRCAQFSVFTGESLAVL
jgi:hypothetical protein